MGADEIEILSRCLILQVDPYTCTGDGSTPSLTRRIRVFVDIKVPLIQQCIFIGLIEDRVVGIVFILTFHGIVSITGQAITQILQLALSRRSILVIPRHLFHSDHIEIVLSDLPHDVGTPVCPQSFSRVSIGGIDISDIIIAQTMHTARRLCHERCACYREQYEKTYSLVHFSYFNSCPTIL